MPTPPNVQTQRFAAIDIGTNTLLMLVGELDAQGNISILRDEHAIARLGKGVDITGYIAEENIERTAQIFTYYKSLLSSGNKNIKISAVTTSAIRDAENAEDVLQKLSARLGAEIRVISGEEEAELSFRGSAEIDKRCTVIDIGGGSTEFITGENKLSSSRISLQIGAVRLFERILRSLPASPQAIEKARTEILHHLQHVQEHRLGEIIGVGGTFTTLAAIDLKLQTFDSTAVHLHRMSADTVQTITQWLLSASHDELLANHAIHPQRADILPTGALILDETLKFFGASECKASTKGLRYGLLDTMIQQYIKSH